MSDMYADLKETAASLIAEFGQGAIIRRVTSVVDPVTGESTDTTTDYSCSALENSVNALTAYSASLQAGSLVSESDRFFTLASDEAPQASDKLILGALSLVIQGVRPLSPGAVAIYYEVRARG